MKSDGGHVTWVRNIPDRWGRSRRGSQTSGSDGQPAAIYASGVNSDRARRTRDDVVRLARRGDDWVTFATEVTEMIRRVVSFDRNCWHTVDPGTVLFTGSLNQNVTCSGSWLAEHEYVIDDVNKWWFLARSGRRAGATSLATHGDLCRSARHRSHASFGIGDELRCSFVLDGTYWGATGFLRDEGLPWFTEDDVRFLASLSEPIAEGLRRALVAAVASEDVVADVDGPGVVVFDAHGNAESVSPAAEHWITQIVEEPQPALVAESKMIQAVAARARTLARGDDPVPLAARSRVRTRGGTWLLLYGTALRGNTEGRTAVIVQPAAPSDVAPLVALAYGLSERERQVTQLCMQGQPTKEMARTLNVSAYTVQDHLKSIFDKTGVRTRGELVGQVFLEHYAPRWEGLENPPRGWTAQAVPQP